MVRKFVLVLHGGAGVISKVEASIEQQFHDGMHAALETGRAVLVAGGGAVDAVVATVMALEDNPLFNAGRGAVFNAAREHELDAAVMDGTTLKAGAVASVRRIRNPILAALEVMRNGRSVLLSAAGAEAFAIERGLTMVEPSYFSTLLRLNQWEALRARGDGGQAPDNDISPEIDPQEERFGTVGAVALDHQGAVAAATSTGGVINKQVGRVGDTPVIGAGTFADNRTCAVSATGTGEHFIRGCIGHDIHARMHYDRQGLDGAMVATIRDTLTPLGGKGGIIGVDAAGNIAMRFNSKGMYRAWLREGEGPGTAIY